MYSEMSLLKLLKAPAKLFKKDIITFLIIRRYDLGVIEEKLRYIAVPPTASISLLRQKVWHLLYLPDYCEEVIILKADDCEIPLTHLRKGNDPQHSYILEVWLPGKHRKLNSNMLTMATGDAKRRSDDLSTTSDVFEENVELHLSEKHCNDNKSKFPLPNDGASLNKFHIIKNHSNNILHSECKQSDISCKISTSSIFYKLHGKKSRDNFANILMKIQSDLNTLSNKLSNLENKIQL